MINQKEKFSHFIGAKKYPNEREKSMFERANFYIDKIKNIRGIKLVAICNSLSMNATNEHSDIDLFIVTHEKMIWYVRFFVTFWLWKWWVWRKWDDIANNFCLSFFATENALNTENFSISDDIYLYFWTYFLRPILNYDNTYEKFLQKNSWIAWNESQTLENKSYIKILGKAKKVRWYHIFVNNFLRFFIKRKTMKNYIKQNRPSGVIISDDMLKFHDKDQREHIKKKFSEWKTYKKDF